MSLTDDQVLTRAATLAGRAAGARLPDNHLGWVLAHLRRHRDTGATLQLLSQLTRSSFALRTDQTRPQLEALDAALKDALSRVADWEDAARIVGWARRLVKAQPRAGAPRGAQV